MINFESKIIVKIEKKIRTCIVIVRHCMRGYVCCIFFNTVSI